MTNAKPTETNVPTDAKRTVRDRLHLSNSTNSNSESKLKNLGSKAKTSAAVVGVVALAAVGYVTVAKRKSLKVEVTAPAVDVTTESA